MKINKFYELVATIEGGKEQVNIAQIAEITKIIDQLTDGLLYKCIKNTWIKGHIETKKLKAKRTGTEQA